MVNIWKQTFSKGKTTSTLVNIGTTEEHGTKIFFIPDAEIFEEIDFDYETVSQRLRELAFLNKGIRITLTDEREDKKQEFLYEGGIKSFVDYLNRNKGKIHDTIYIEGSKDEYIVEIALQYNDTYTENLFSFANNIDTVEGGTHLVGFKTALTRVVNDYAKKFGFLKENDKNLSGEDVREGLTAVISIKLTDPQFEGQTKTKLGNSEVRGIVDGIVGEAISNVLEENPQLGKNIIDKALNAARARDAAKKQENLQEENQYLKVLLFLGNYQIVLQKILWNVKYILVEGDSAGGSAKQGRDRKFQAILPLKGKIMNVEKQRIDKMLASLEIRAMITAFGAGIGKDFDVKKIRYDRIIIMTDADVDGAHIRTLLLTFFYRYMKELVEGGHVYVAQPPLYKVSKGKKEHYVYTDKELAKVTCGNRWKR